MPLCFVKALCKVVPFYYKLTNNKSLFTSYSIEVLNINCDISSLKAHKELDFSPRSLKESIKDSIEWFRENNYV